MTHPVHHALRSAALAAAERGWPVFPLRPGDKRPAITAWEQRATTDSARIERCWAHTPYNVGIATGPAGLVVVDLDTPKGANDVPPAAWALPGIGDGADVLAVLAERRGQPYPGHTFTVRTGRGGAHLYFTAPDGAELHNSGGKLGWKVDTRAAGGYVVASGSVVNGRRYETTHDTAPAPLPAWLLQALRPAPAPTGTLGQVPTGRRAVGLVRTVLDAGEGQRNNRLYWAALRAYESGGAAAEGISEALVGAAVAVGLPEREARATVASAARRARGER
ncbi:bifunctional DNA primase/polymerase [Streptomyces sp. HPF1205]|uniref:bifunctional DNA primase/polymerase n=1 Tax=Streptomyces sp. HPF1205 TaxID=2873262 RepID=UPI001CEC2F01|nr:bifunctional DNA primase/polymerase [Streptomyces sp. HPF1205]